MEKGQATTGTETGDRPEFPEFDPLVPDHIRDPWPILARARREQPVFWIPSLGMHCVTKYSDIKAILADSETFSNAGANVMRVPVPDDIEIPPGCPFPSVGDGLANQDGDDHFRLRRLMQPAFGRRRVASYADQIRGIADELIDDFEPNGSADLVVEFANELAMQTIAVVLGFKREDSREFRAWTNQFLYLLSSPGMDQEEARRLWVGLIEWYKHIEALVQRRRETPADDLISDLMAAEPPEGVKPLTDSEIIANVIAFIVAGTDTTAILITQTVRRLHEEGLWQALREDRDSVEAVIEESLRLTGVVRGLNRVVTKDTELSGVRIPAGSVIYWMGSSANRDEEKFENPAKFDLQRKNTHEHVAFSGGRHFCIGAPLARLESKIGLNALLDRLPNLRVTEPEVELHPSFITPTPKRLLIEWGA